MDLTVKIGTRWQDRNGRECIVFDCYTTWSLAGVQVRKEWVSYHSFLGQRVEHIDNDTTVRMGIARAAEPTKRIKR